MFEWLKALLTHGKTVIYIDSVTFDCGCCPSLRPPDAPALKPVLLKGETVVMIKYPVTVAPNTTNTDVEKTRIITTPEGQPSTSEDFMGNGGTFKSAAVEDGSNGTVQSAFVDRKGNVSPLSPAATYTNASDETPPDGPAGAPTLGAGDSV